MKKWLLFIISFILVFGFPMRCVAAVDAETVISDAGGETADFNLFRLFAKRKGSYCPYSRYSCRLCMRRGYEQL